MNEKSRVYILCDAENRVTRIEGEYTLPSDLTGWVLVEEGSPCDRLNLAQTHYLEKPLMTDDGVYRYKYSRNKIVERTQAEIDADIVPAEPVPDRLDVIESQVLYTALMTDTLIESED